MKTTLALILLLIGRSISAQRLELGTPMETYRFPRTVTTLFRWDAAHVAVLDPTKNVLSVLGTGQKIALDSTFRAHSGVIYPDAIERYGDQIFWATQAKQLGVFHIDGSLDRTYPLRGAPLSLKVRNDEARIVITLAEGVWETIVLPDGKVSYEQGWLPHTDEHPDHGTWFREVVGEQVVEVAAFYPVARIDSKLFSLDGPCLSKVVEAPELRKINTEHDLRPWALATDHPPASPFVHVVLNGGLLVTIDAQQRRYTCVPIPRPAENRYAHTGVAVAGDRMWILTRTQTDVLVRSWPLRVRLE